MCNGCMWQALHQTARQSVSLSVRTSTSRSGGFWVRLSCQFLLGCLRSIDLIGRPAAEDRVGPIGIVVADPPTDHCSCRTAGLEGIEVTHSYFNDRHSRSMKTLSARRRGSVRARCPSRRTPWPASPPPHASGQQSGSGAVRACSPTLRLL